VFVSIDPIVFGRTLDWRAWLEYGMFVWFGTKGMGSIVWRYDNWLDRFCVVRKGIAAVLRDCFHFGASAVAAEPAVTWECFVAVIRKKAAIRSAVAAAVAASKADFGNADVAS